MFCTIIMFLMKINYEHWENNKDEGENNKFYISNVLLVILLEALPLKDTY